jgi:DeoR/GlpR family transcriptional regulator of sugar metabolism
VVVADHTKWGVVGLAQIAPLRAVTTLLTDDLLPPGAAEVLSEQVGEVIIIPTSEH